MPLYLIRFSYTPEAWAKLVKEYAFGDHDGYVLGEAPDNTSAASALLAVAGSGAFRSLSTTVLLTVEETLDALRGAQSIAYRPPGG